MRGALQRMIQHIKLQEDTKGRYPMGHTWKSDKKITNHTYSWKYAISSNSEAKAGGYE